ncbi:MAG: ABC transporter ATP-binding protein [Pseudomonadota bacterium]
MTLRASDVTKRFPGMDRPVLDHVSLALDAGETVALTGESGSGKSTLLHIVAGLEPADGGSIEIEGAAIDAMKDPERATLRRAKLGIVFQQFNLIPSLTVAKNLRFQADLAGVALQSDDINILAEALGIIDQLGKYPEELSGGQQQRVAIGRALMHKPKLVLADEPTGNLDETTSDAVFDLLLAETAKTGAALMLVTHSEKLAARADRRLRLSHGQVAE